MRETHEAESDRVWVEVPDVGDDNGRHFPEAGAEAERRGITGCAPAPLSS
ncbi:hypothetical protein [Streptomyces sp. SID9124]|nr:hypothetical protein [Streptomyces sp. SID9124]